MIQVSAYHIIVRAYVSNIFFYLYREDSDDKGEITEEYQQHSPED